MVENKVKSQVSRFCFQEDPHSVQGEQNFFTPRRMRRSSGLVMRNLYAIK